MRIVYETIYHLQGVCVQHTIHHTRLAVFNETRACSIGVHATSADASVQAVA